MGVTNFLPWSGVASAHENSFIVLVPGERFEMRLYPNQFMAKIEVTGDLKAAIKSGTQVLQEYLSGENLKQERISPPTSWHTALLGDRWVILARLPRRFNFSNVPHPIDQRIHFSQSPAHRRAILKFRESATEAMVEEKLLTLKNWVMEKKLTPGLPPILEITRSVLFTRNELHIECL